MENKCYVCSKKIEKHFIKKYNKYFCCRDCIIHYDDKNKPDKKAKVCEFC